MTSLAMMIVKTEGDRYCMKIASRRRLLPVIAILIALCGTGSEMHVLYCIVLCIVYCVL